MTDMKRINPDLQKMNQRFDAYSGKWEVGAWIERDNTVYVCPVTDGFPHETGGWTENAANMPLCQCAPVLEEQESGVVLVIHKAMPPGSYKEPTDKEW